MNKKFFYMKDKIKSKKERKSRKEEKIKANAFKLYNEKTNRPNSKISKRCCDFKVLEEKCRKYKRDY